MTRSPKDIILTELLQRDRAAGLLRATAVGLALVLAGASGQILVAPAALAQATADDALPEGAIAKINDEIVSEYDFAAYLHGYAREKLYHGGSPEQLERVAGDAMERLIDERLVLAEAEARGLKGDPERAEAEINKLRAQYEDSEGWANVEPRLPLIRQNLMAKTKMLQLRQEIEKVEEPDEATLAAYHKENIHLFTQPQSHDLDVIVIGAPPSGEKDLWAEAEAKAEETLKELRGGADFAALAKERSSDVSREEGGKLGRVHAGQLATEVEEKIAEAPAGSFVGPVKMLEGYAVFRINKRNPSVVHSLEEVRERATGLYMRQKTEQQWADFIMKLRADADVTVGDLKAVSMRLATRPAADN